MCTYLTEKIDVDGSGKGATGWFAASQATVYVDHPVHAPYGHTVNIDVLNPALGPSARRRTRADRRDRPCAGRRNPPRHRLGPRGLGVEEPNGLTASTSEPAASCANRLGGVGVGEGELRLVSAGDEERELSRFAGDSQRRTVGRQRRPSRRPASVASPGPAPSPWSAGP